MTNPALTPIANVSPENIWEYPQNKRRLVVAGLQRFVGGWGAYLRQEDIERVLMATGVNKAFATRRKLIWMKQRIKARIRHCSENAHNLGPKQRTRNAGYMAGLNEALRDIREILNGPRWTHIE